MTPAILHCLFDPVNGTYQMVDVFWGKVLDKYCELIEEEDQKGGTIDSCDANSLKLHFAETHK